MAEESNSPEVLAPQQLPLPEVNGAVAETAATLAQRLTSWIDAQQWVPESFAHPLANLTLLAGLFLSAWLLFAIFRPLILRWVKYAVSRTTFQWDDQLLGHGVFRWLTHLLPGLLIYLCAPGLFESSPILVQTDGRSR